MIKFSIALLCSISVTHAIDYVEFPGSKLAEVQDFTLCFRVLFNKMSSRQFEIVGSMEPLVTPAPYYWSIGTVAVPCDVNYPGDLIMIKILLLYKSNLIIIFLFY